MIHILPLIKSKYFHYKKDWENAANELEKVLPSLLTINRWHYQLGFYYSKLKRWQDAEKHLQIATRDKNGSKRWFYRHAIALENIDNKSKAKEIFKIITERNGVDAKKHYESGVLLLGFSRFSAAEDSFRLAIELDDRKPIYFSQLALSLNKQSKWWQEAEALEKALLIHKNDSDLLYRLGVVLEKLEDYKRAIDVFSEAAKLKPNNSDIYYLLGYCQERLGLADLARESYSMAINHDNTLNAKRFGIGAFHRKRGLWTEAALAFTEKSKLNHSDADLIYNTGLAYDRCYDWKTAERFYKAALQFKPGHSNWNYRLGFVLERQNKWKEAATKYEVATRSSVKHNTHYFYRLGYCLTKSKQLDKACLAFLMMRINRDGHTSKLNYKLFSSNPWTAEELYQRALEMDAAGNSLSAINYYRLATKKNNGYSSEYYYHLGYAYFKSGDYKNAVNAFLETRILSKSYGVELNDFDKNNSTKKKNSYLEYFERLEVIDNVVLFESFHGASVSCNPFALYKHMLSRPEFKSFTYIWVLKTGVKIPESIRRKSNVIVIQRESDAYLRYLSSAKYLINNVTFPEYFIRKEKQVYLNTWHGTPIKFLGKDIKDSFLSHHNVTRNLLQATHVISQNDYTNDILMNRYDAAKLSTAIVAATGYPRIDITMNQSSDEITKLRQRLKVKNDEKIILYAPTWRGEHGKARFDTTRLIDDLKIMSSLGHKVLFRGHHMIENLLSGLSLPVQIVPQDIDTNQLLASVDLLITDYSSIAFDFLPLKRPIIYYAYDLDEYLEERGLYFSLEEMPGHVCYIKSNLYDTIQTSLKTTINDDDIRKLNYFCPHEDGKASARVIDMLFFGKRLDKIVDEHERKKNILIYAGPFLPNGIATSTNNLLQHIDHSKYNVSLAVDVNSINGFPDRLEEISKVPDNVSIIGYKGSPNMNLEESWILTKFDSTKTFQSQEMEKIYLNAFYRDFRRAFGFKPFDAIVNFEGYNKKWVSLFASIPDNIAKKKVIYQHNDMLSEFQSKYPYLKCNFSLYNKYDSIISVSEATRDLNRDNLSELFDINKDKFTFADNVQNPDYVLKSLDADFDDSMIFDDDVYTFITMGRMSPEKDHIKLITAFNEVHKYNLKTQLIILGDGPLRSEITSLVKKLGLNNAVHLLGRKSNPFPYMKRSNCFVLSSNHEGQPMVLFEAMILKLPIVATNIVGNRGVLQGRTGILVDNNVQGLVDGMIASLDDKVEKNHFDHEHYQMNAISMFYNQIEARNK
ncbi:CDP-glycerol glycerophosphotransferase family protein [Aeromonas sp. R4-3]|uniref:CDP-glycerol glycerophosphotransferase family protein n=1 Tax=Aeromonas sp. R4-3 TaxID=3138466 RepID=UPI0034A44719